MYYMKLDDWFDTRTIGNVDIRFQEYFDEIYKEYSNLGIESSLAEPRFWKKYYFDKDIEIKQIVLELAMEKIRDILDYINIEYEVNLTDKIIEELQQ